MELADIAPIPDFSNETLLSLAERLETSHSLQELIVREVELDAVFRRVDSAVRTSENDAAGMDGHDMLQRVRSLVCEAHDLAGAGQPLEAARRLRSAMSMEPRP